MEGLLPLLDQNGTVFLEGIQSDHQLLVSYLFIVDGKSPLFDGTEAFAVGGY